MTQFTDLFKPEVVFSSGNPFLKSAAATHRLVFETIDRAARAQFAFAEDLLDLNRDRFELLYAGKSFSDTLEAQQELFAEFGKRAVKYAGDLQEVAEAIREGVTDATFEAANEPDKSAGRTAKSTKSKKAA